MKITSLQNDFVKHLVKLQQKKHRDASNQILLEGEHLHQEILNAGISHQTIGTDASYDIEITSQIAKKISTTQSGSNLFTLIDKPHHNHDFNGSRYLLVDGVQDPGNLGTMIRTAYSFGFDAVLLSQDSVDEFNDKCIRSTQGSIFHIPCIRGNLIDFINKLRAKNVKVYATNLSHETIGLETVDKDSRLAIVMGHEGQGVSEAVINHCDQSVKIATSRFESLNVAVATAVVCYLLRK